MSTIRPEALLEQLRWRYATKKFDASKKIPAEIWQSLEDALILSPSSFGLQPLKFTVVLDPAVRAQLKAAAWNQPQVEDCSHLVVFSYKKDTGLAEIEHYLDRIVEVRGVPLESLSGFKDMMVGAIVQGNFPVKVNCWASRQVYIALGVLLSSAAILGIDACPMEGFDPDAFDKILGLDAKGYHSVCMATLGYRDEADAYAQWAKVRFKADELIDRF